MQLDAELAKDFVSEVQLLETELKLIVGQLDRSLDQPKAFENFAQVIDRIYGTAATFGMKELAAYCGMLKKTCYDCAKSENKRGHQKVLGLMKTCLENIDALRRGINDPEVMKKIHHTLHLEIQKANRLHEEIFQHNKK
jgi:hypothetical protein